MGTCSSDAVAVILFLFVIRMYAAILLLPLTITLQPRPKYLTFATFVWWTAVASGVELRVLRREKAIATLGGGAPRR